MRVVRVAEIKKKSKGKYTRKKDGKKVEYCDPALNVPSSLLKVMGWKEGKVGFMESLGYNSITMIREDTTPKTAFGWDKKKSRKEIRKAIKKIPQRYRITNAEFNKLAEYLEKGKRMSGRMKEILKMYRIWHYFDMQRHFIYNWKRLNIEKITFPDKEKKEDDGK